MDDKRKPDGKQAFEEVLVYGSQEELNELRSWLFQENIRLENDKCEFRKSEQRFVKEREQFQNEMKELNQKIVIERKRLREDTQFFDKKLEILKNGFTQLDLDRRRLEKERIRLDAERSATQEVNLYHKQNELAELFFSGVNSPLALKKRYKDLLKMYHPDNLAGDHEMVLVINRIYEDLKKAYEYGRQA